VQRVKRVIVFLVLLSLGSFACILASYKHGYIKGRENTFRDFTLAKCWVESGSNDVVCYQWGDY